MKAVKKESPLSVRVEKKTKADLILLAIQEKRKLADYIRFKLEALVEGEKENLAKLRGSK